MSGRHRSAGKASVGLIALIGGIVALLASVLASGTASAATTVKAQLSLSGVATASSPTGGTTVGIHPGDSVTISASTAPTQGLEALGLDGLLGGLLNGIAGFQVTADFSHLPDGKASTVLKSSTATTFTFPKAGTYDFTWTAQRVTLLGLVPIDLNGNQLAAAGIKLNADSEYVGQIVVAADPPKGGVSVQLPKVQASPSIPVVGNLPTVTVPRVSVPTLPVSIPTSGLGNLIPKPKPSSSTHTAKPKPAGKPKPQAQVAYQAPPAQTIPDMVVPKGNGVPSIDLGNLGGKAPTLSLDSFGVEPGSAANVGGSQVQVGDASSPLTAASGSDVNDAKLPPVAQDQIELASNPEPTSQLPVLLAIAAILALATVTALYARMYLLNKS